MIRQPRSIRLHLSAVCFFFFLLVIAVGLFGISRLSEFNRVAEGIADIWLPDTRAIGDLNNFTSDFRAAEGSDILSSSEAQIAAVGREMQTLDAAIVQAQQSYERIPHEGEPAQVYRSFKQQWTKYRNLVNDVLALSHTNRKAEANALYMTTSKQAYDAASDLLDRLTDLNVANARAASTRVAAAYQQAQWLIGMAIIIAALIAAVALLYVKHWISDPILRLADTMHHLVDKDTAIDIQGRDRRDEIGEMARAAVVFRDNAIELRVSQRGLAQQASMLEERLSAERQLTLRQRNFLSMASHEFRTPLTIIDAHAQRLIKLNQRLPGEEIVERAGKVRGAVLRMTHLIENLLNSSRLVDSEVALYFHPSEFDIAVLAREVCQLHRDISPNAQILQSVGSQPLMMFGDPKLLFQVFSNILANAIKYSPGGGLIKFEATRAGDRVEIAIEDHGIGIPATDLSRLFERYYRGSNAAGMVGTGIGLYLAKMVVELHNGSIAIASREGEGSKFTVSLPVRPAPQRSSSPSSEPMPADTGIEHRVAS